MHGLLTVNGKACGKIIKKVFDYEQRNESQKLLSKLTYTHFEFDTWDKMRVYLAVQIFSESCASAIETMLSIDFFDSKKEAESTMVFCRNMNILFDLLNSKHPNDSNVNKRGINPSSFQLLKDLKVYISTLEQCGGNKVFCITGLIQSVNAVIQLYEEHFQSSFLLTRFLNQDPLENLFGLIRGQAINTNNPYLIDFLRILSRIITMKIDLKIEHSNCEWDSSTVISVVDPVKPEENKESEWEDFEEVCVFT